MPKSLKDFVDEALQSVPEVTTEETQALIEDPEWMVLDVREPDEFAAGHLERAINIPRGFLEVKADLDHPKKDDRLKDRSQKIVLYCGGGHRSALAGKALQEMGFQEVVSMRGGWTAWTNEGRPTLK
jgi:rhodanese-related sulfurtransferase